MCHCFTNLNFKKNTQHTSHKWFKIVNNIACVISCPIYSLFRVFRKAILNLAVQYVYNITLLRDYQSSLVDAHGVSDNFLSV